MQIVDLARCERPREQYELFVCAVAEAKHALHLVCGLARCTDERHRQRELDRERRHHEVALRPSERAVEVDAKRVHRAGATFEGKVAHSVEATITWGLVVTRTHAYVDLALRGRCRRPLRVCVQGQASADEGGRHRVRA